MIVGQAGITAAGSGGEGFPPYGTPLSSACVDAGPYTDAFNTEWNGFYTLSQTFANGEGGTYTETVLGGGACYLPNGYGIQENSAGGPISLPWNDGVGATGTFIAGNVTASYRYADGSGGTYDTGGDYIFDFPDYYVINETFTGSGGVLTKLRAVAPGSVEYENYTCESYGTKSGLPYWDSSNMALYQNYHDGSCGTYSQEWDGSPPYPANGTFLGSYYSCDNTATDARNTIWTNICGTTNTTALDYPGTDSSFVIDEGVLPEGWALSDTTVHENIYDTNYVVYDVFGNAVSPWGYGWLSANGVGGSVLMEETPPIGTILSTTITIIDNDAWVSAQIEADGSGGYVLQTL